MQYKEAGSDKIFNFINYTLITLFFLIVLYPLIFVLSASFSDPTAVIQGKVKLWPVGINLEGYTAVFKHRLIVSGYLNSLFYMITGTLLNVVLTIMAAYPLSRKDFVDRGLFTALFIFTMMFSGGMIPTYLVIKELGLVNTRWAMILPSAMGIWNVVITRTYFETNIPDELLEASQLDGCTDFQFIGKIVIPLSGAIIAVITLFYAVGHWNAFFDALLYLTDAKKFPLQMVLRDILIENQISSDMLSGTDIKSLAFKENIRELLKYSLIVVASAPLLILYPFIQKYFVKGVMIGALKG